MNEPPKIYTKAIIAQNLAGIKKKRKNNLVFCLTKMSPEKRPKNSRKPLYYRHSKKSKTKQPKNGGNHDEKVFGVFWKLLIG